MTRHVHADLIHAWAEGAIIQCKLDQFDWIDLKYPVFTDGFKYRIKPKWWENIPEHGVLVRRIDNPNSILILYNNNLEFFDYKKYWTPLTNEEIERFKR